ncbi:hypothetical protein ACDI77_27295, partial [Klebsiella pneumoniae]
MKTFVSRDVVFFEDQPYFSKTEKSLQNCNENLSLEEYDNGLFNEFFLTLEKSSLNPNKELVEKPAKPN